MAGYTAATNIAELIPEITNEVQYIYQDRAIGPDLVTFQDVSGIPGTVVEFPRFTEVVGSTGVAENTAPTSHQLDLSMPTLTLARRAVYIGLSDLAKKGARGNVVAQIGRAMAEAKAKQDDAAIFGVLTATTNWTTGTGATNAALTITNALDALNLLEKNEVNEEIYCVVHPHQYKSIRSALTPVANDDGVAVGVASDMARDAMVSRAFGMNWFVTNRIGSGTVTATANVYNGLVFAKSAIGYAHAWGEANGVEAQRAVELAMTKLIINYFDAAGVIYGSGVAKLYSTSA
jgi:hypothetical protein